MIVRPAFLMCPPALRSSCPRFSTFSMDFFTSAMDSPMPFCILSNAFLMPSAETAPSNAFTPVRLKPSTASFAPSTICAFISASRFCIAWSLPSTASATRDTKRFAGFSCIVASCPLTSCSSANALFSLSAMLSTCQSIME